VLRPYELAAQRYVAAGTLKILLREWSGTRQPVSAVTSSRLVPAKVRAFLEYAHAVVSAR